VINSIISERTSLIAPTSTATASRRVKLVEPAARSGALIRLGSLDPFGALGSHGSLIKHGFSRMSWLAFIYMAFAMGNNNLGNKRYDAVPEDRTYSLRG
jgi:hypothetical protein